MSENTPHNKVPNTHNTTETAESSYIHGKITFDRFIRGIIGLAILVGLYLLMVRLSGVLLPFFAALLIAYFLFPLVKLFQYKLKLKSRILSIICTFIVVIAVLTGIFYFLVPPMVEETGRVKSLVTEYFSEGHKGANIPAVINDFVSQHLDAEQLKGLLTQKDFMTVIHDALPKVWKVLAQSLNLFMSLFNLVMVVLYTLFILFDYETITKGWPKLIPQKYRHIATSLVDDIEYSMNRYFRGQALVAFCVGVLFSIGFLIIDFPMAIVLGMFIGALNLVPYLQVVGFIPTILLAILKAADTGGNFWLILLSALIVFAVVQTIQDTILVPKIMGDVTGFNPAIILLSLSVWGSLLGMLGMIIALPVTTLLVSYYNRYIIREEDDQGLIDAGTPPPEETALDAVEEMKAAEEKLE